MLSLIQFGFNTSDLAATLRLYSEALGFRNAGGQGFWGESIRIQGLGPESRALIWWMVGTQPLFQLEIFHHTRPVQRPLIEGWRPSDHGWVRFGVSVPDFDKTMSAIASNDIAVPACSQDATGSRRAVFFDPYVGVMIEVREARGTEGPIALYATSSVSNLDAAKLYYHDILGFELAPIEQLHSLEDEALWGLAGASREGFLVKAGAALIEIVRYDQPLGRPQRADRMSSDQGFTNVAFGSPDRAPVVDALQKLKDNGIVPPKLFETDKLLAAYIVDPERETEFAVIPEELSAALGFTPVMAFFG